MRPLQSVGMGLLLLLLTTDAGSAGVDVFPDPLGWLLAWWGVRRLPDHLQHRAALSTTAVVAGLVSLALWIPVASVELATARLPSPLQWVLILPQQAFLGLLAVSLAAAAGAGGDAGARAWWRTLLVSAVVVALLPAVVLGGGLEDLVQVGAAVSVLSLAVAVVLCFVHAPRPWIHEELTPDAAGPPLREEGRS